VKRIAAIAAISIATAACGGSGSGKLYAKAATRACLDAKGLRTSAVSSSTDFVADSATGGAFRARLSDNRVTISFGLTADDADNINQAYLTFHAKNVGIEDVLRQQGNAVMLWHVHPSDADVKTVTGCLKG
jgi:hypothetical protein